MNEERGFSIIELIVVIVIIAALATIVLMNVSQYLGKGKDSAIQANLSGVLTNATAFFESGSDYNGFCNSAGVNAAQSAVTSTGGNFTCNVDAASDAWCACSPLVSDATSVFCVDSTGTKKTTPATDCATECPVDGACL